MLLQRGVRGKGLCVEEEKSFEKQGFFVELLGCRGEDQSGGEGESEEPGREGGVHERFEWEKVL